MIPFFAGAYHHTGYSIYYLLKKQHMIFPVTMNAKWDYVICVHVFDQPKHQSHINKSVRNTAKKTNNPDCLYPNTRSTRKRF